MKIEYLLRHGYQNVSDSIFVQCSEHIEYIYICPGRQSKEIKIPQSIIVQ